MTLKKLRLTLPPEAVKRLGEAGIRCTPEVSLEYQRAPVRYVLRGRESGGAVKQLGRYVSFCGDEGERLSWFIRPDSVVSNGDHAIVIAPTLVSIEVFRFEHTYELLVARHSILAAQQGKRPVIATRVLFRGWQGQLPLDLIEKDQALAGKIAPEFFTRSGEPRQIPAQFVAAVQSVVEAVNCPNCRHCHLLVAKPAAASAAPPAEIAAEPVVDNPGQPEPVAAAVA
jgi:hypothetical protein